MHLMSLIAHEFPVMYKVAHCVYECMAIQVVYCYMLTPCMEC